MTMQLRWLGVCMVAVCVAIGFGGCGSRTVAPGVATPEDGEKVTVRTAGSKTKFTKGDSSVDLPDKFPEDMPLYPGATVKAASESVGMTMVSLETSDSAKQVWDYYKKELDDEKWKVVSTINTPDGGQISVEKNKHVCSVIIAAEKRSGGATATIMLHSRPTP